ncbi:MAG: GHKL domain-containing protein [Treponema sp.]|nr:GHKL domain-containing protein [Candidatus Treponema equi]
MNGSEFKMTSSVNFFTLELSIRMFDLIVNGVAGVVDVILCCDLFFHFYDWRFEKRKGLLLCCLIFFLAAVANLTFVGIFIKDPVVANYERISVTIILGLTMCFIGYRAKPMEIILLFGIFYIFEIIAESLYMFILAVFRIDYCTNIQGTAGTEIIFVALQKFLTLLISKAYQKLIGRKKRMIEGKLYVCLLFLPLVTIFICVYLYRMETCSPKDKTFIDIAVPLLVFSNAIVLAVVEKLSRLQNDHYELDFYKQKVDMEKQYYDHLDEIEQKQVSVRHDIKHYISVMKVLAEENRMDDLKKLILSFESGMANITPQVYTNNRMVNAILSEKKSVAEKNGIIINFTVEPGVDLAYLNDLDAISLFGNLIDNAIRAETECDVLNKEITFNLFEGDGQFNILNISNHFVKVEVKGGKYLTTKKEDGIHGIGLKNVEHIVAKYNGIFSTERDGNVFEVTVCLPKNRKPSLK